MHDKHLKADSCPLTVIIIMPTNTLLTLIGDFIYFQPEGFQYFHLDFKLRLPDKEGPNLF